MLAVGGKDCHVSLISMTSTSVVCLLKGHTKELLDFAACAARCALFTQAAVPSPQLLLLGCAR